MSEPILEARGLSFAYDAAEVLREVSLALRPGEFVGLIGPNGSGKSTLLRALLGLLPAKRGEARLKGRKLADLSRLEIARTAALLPQETAAGFAFSALEVVAMGRNPHLGRFRPEGAHDREAIQWALKATGTEAFAARPVTELSGGERQRVLIARALAQEAEALLLDEPTASLDVAHQLELLKLARKLAADGRAVLAALHDLGLAARFCTRLAILSEGRIAADGPPEAVLTEANLAAHFRIKARVRREAETGALSVLPLEPE
ncbi:MAG: heme ABC transporter ATP-binding protein [Planctomycetota bacterium]|nr:heme ABC transporter ATP-binding protein [Planctomycetota bacterium]